MRALRIALALIIVVAPLRKASAQILEGNISVFADPQGASCFVNDADVATFSLYVLHTNMAGTYISHLKVAEGSGFTATYVSETVALAHIGDLRTGISIAYGGCKSGPLLLGTIVYLGHGTSLPCSVLDTTGNPNWPGIPTPYPLTENCNLDVLPAPSLGPLYVNPEPTCEPRCVVATESTTWGKVKALYRD